MGVNAGGIGKFFLNPKECRCGARYDAVKGGPCHRTPPRVAPAPVGVKDTPPDCTRCDMSKPRPIQVPIFLHRHSESLRSHARGGGRHA